MHDDLSEFAALDRLEQGGRVTAQLVYGLQGVACFVPLLWFVAAFVIFLKRERYRDTWLEDHFRWQWRTVWFGALWGGLSVFLLVLPPLMWLMASVLTLWLIYRVVKGWLRLSDAQGLY